MASIYIRICEPPIFSQIPWPRLPESMLLVGLNWLGDVVMAMPAVMSYRKRFPDVKITVLSRAPLGDLWKMCDFVDDVIELPRKVRGMRQLAKDIRGSGYDTACILPNSFRSALVPWMARIPQRRGIGGDLRSFLLSDLLPRWSPAGVHQSWEAARILGLRADDLDDMQPSMAVNASEADAVAERLKLGSTALIGLLPGAARGGVKRWPVEYVVELARELKRERGVGFAVMGTAAESDLCDSVAAEIGEGAFSVAGRTTLRELALLLSRCKVVVCNDSGGMHLAAAVGAPVVAVYGITDPEKTGPLGPMSRVVTLPGVRHRRDVPRESSEARKVMSRIKPQRVFTEVSSLLDEVDG